MTLIKLIINHWTFTKDSRTINEQTSNTKIVRFRFRNCSHNRYTDQEELLIYWHMCNETTPCTHCKISYYHHHYQEVYTRSKLSIFSLRKALECTDFCHFERKRCCYSDNKQLLVCLLHPLLLLLIIFQRFF